MLGQHVKLTAAGGQLDSTAPVCCTVTDVVIEDPGIFEAISQLF